MKKLHFGLHGGDVARTETLIRRYVAKCKEQRLDPHTAGLLRMPAADPPRPREPLSAAAKAELIALYEEREGQAKSAGADKFDRIAQIEARIAELHRGEGAPS